MCSEDYYKTRGVLGKVWPVFKVFPLNTHPVWCHDCNLDQHPAPIKEIDAYGTNL